MFKGLKGLKLEKFPIFSNAAQKLLTDPSFEHSSCGNLISEDKCSRIRQRKVSIRWPEKHLGIKQPFSESESESKNIQSLR